MLNGKLCGHKAQFCRCLLILHRWISFLWIHLNWTGFFKSCLISKHFNNSMRCDFEHGHFACFCRIFPKTNSTTSMRVLSCIKTHMCACMANVLHNYTLHAHANTQQNYNHKHKCREWRDSFIFHQYQMHK